MNFTGQYCRHVPNGVHSWLAAAALALETTHDQRAVVVTLEFVGFHFSFREKLRHFGERREDPSLGGRQRLCSGRHPQKATAVGPELVQIPANPERHDLRKNPDFTGFFAAPRMNSRTQSMHQIGSVRRIMGQHGVILLISFRRSGSRLKAGVLQNKSSSSNFSSVMLGTREQPGPSCLAATRP